MSKARVPETLHSLPDHLKKMLRYWRAIALKDRT